MAEGIKAIDVHGHPLRPGLPAEAVRDEGTRRKVLRGNAERLFG